MCAARYRIDRGIPLLIGKRSQLNHSEVETQDRVSDGYDGVRLGWGVIIAATKPTRRRTYPFVR